MITQLRGTVVARESGAVILNVGGVGYKVWASADTLVEIAKRGKGEMLLWTHLAVRENSMNLYGFANEKELRLFELLIGVSGIGPKSALAILTLTTIEMLQKAIASHDTSYLTKVSGIGKKTADKIVLELRDKVQITDDASIGLREEADVLEVLRSLGYSLQESRDALKNVDGKIVGTSERVRAVLKMLGST